MGLENVKHGGHHIQEIRNYGLAGALTIEGLPEAPLLRPFQIAMKCWEKGLYIRYGGDTIQLGLPFTAHKEEIDNIVNAIGESIRELD